LFHQTNGYVSQGNSLLYIVQADVFPDQGVSFYEGVI